MTPVEQTELDFEALKPYEARAFVPKNADLTQLEALAPLYEALLAEKITSQDALEQWLKKRSELESALDQAGSILYIRMTCQTDDKARAEKYKAFIETVIPEIKPLEDQLNKKFADAAQKYPFKDDRYDVYLKEIKEDIALFVDENVELEKQEDLLSQDYQTVCGAMTVEFDGGEKTMPQMAKYLLENDRDLRERAWRAMAERRLQDKDKLEEIFDQMIGLRQRIAKNAGCSGYTEYKFRELHRFDYTPDDCKQYHESVQELVVPLCEEITKKRKAKMKLDALRPWDTAVDPMGRQPLKPFDKVDELIFGCQKMFSKVDPELGEQFKGMASGGLLDLASRKGKAPGGYQSSLDEARRPFIFMNAVGLDSDVSTLLHEGGHAFHALACAHDPLVDYRHGPMEFNEVASMAMELLAGRDMSAFYNSEDENRSKEDHLEDIVFTLAWVATIDCFQHWIYEHPGHSRDQRKKAWLEIREQFSTNTVDWSGLEEEQAYVWHRQLHIFEVPFYYIEYGIAQLGALQVWLNAKKDFKKTVKDYRHGLSFGGSKPLPELYSLAGIKFDFSKATIAPLVDALKVELSQIG